MKQLYVLAALLLALGSPFSAGSADGVAPMAADRRPTIQPYEYAVVKWDGPDRLYYNLPDKFELVYLTKTGVTIPKDAQPEEFCLAYAANKMAKENWEVVTLDSRRIVLRRAK